MKYCIKKGLLLLFLSSIYIKFSILYGKFFYNPIITKYLGPFISIGFLFLWFYFGYYNNLGFKKGLFVGIIGRSFGIFSAVSSLILLINAIDGSYIFIMTPWWTPFAYLSDIIFHIKLFDFLGDFTAHLSVVFVIFLTGIGGYLSKFKNTSVI